ELCPGPERRAALVSRAPLDTLPLVRHRRPGFPLLPVGQPPARGGTPLALRRPRWPPAAQCPTAAPDRGVPHALARVPPELRIGGGEAAARRPHVARPHRDGRLLRDRAPPDLGRLVRAPDAGVRAPPDRRVRLRGGARPPAARLATAAGAGDRVRRPARDAGRRRADGELRLLQLSLRR